eukprot:54978-Eustigmatos_ZCMA.PRE.1
MADVKSLVYYRPDAHETDIRRAVFEKMQVCSRHDGRPTCKYVRHAGSCATINILCNVLYERTGILCSMEGVPA